MDMKDKLRGPGLGRPGKVASPTRSDSANRAEQTDRPAIAMATSSASGWDFELAG